MVNLVKNIKFTKFKKDIGSIRKNKYIVQIVYENCVFEEIKDVEFQYCKFINCKFNNLCDVKFHVSTLEKCKFIETLSFCEFSWCNIIEVDNYNCKLKVIGTKFLETSLVNSDIRNYIFNNCNLSGLNLTNTSFDLYNEFSDCQLNIEFFRNLVERQTITHCSVQQLELIGEKSWIVISNLGSRKAPLTAINTVEGIRYQTGCTGLMTEDEFLKKLSFKSKNSLDRKAYISSILFIRDLFENRSLIERCGERIFNRIKKFFK